jgi:hypothetical protein
MSIRKQYYRNPFTELIYHPNEDFQNFLKDQKKECINEWEAKTGLRDVQKINKPGNTQLDLSI